VFEEYQAASGYDHPIGERFSSNHSYRNAYNNLTKSSSVPQDLAEGFFKLKEKFVDDERLARAFESIEGDLDTYVTEAMYIDPADLPDAYRVATTRSDTGTKLPPLFRRVSEYAQELNKLGAEDVQHVVDAVDQIDEWFDESHSAVQLRELYERLYEVVGTLDVTILERWENQMERLESADELHLTAFKSEIESFRDVQSATGPELVGLLHEFEESRNRRVEWDIYECIGEMIQAARDVEVAGAGGELEKEVRNSEEMAAVLDQRAAAEDAIGGDY
jgi:hypothetical protein